MKKIALYILCGVMALFTSCDPSLLDLQNENTLSTGIYWKTESDIEAGVIAVYGMFYRQGTWTRNIYTQMIGMADEGVSYAGWTELNEYTKFIFTDYNFSEVNTKIWREHYTAIFRANQVLDNIVNVPFSDETHKDDLIGQTKFLRAFYYFYLTALWDNIPLVLNTSSASDKPMQATADEILTQIEEDLEDAVNKLPSTRDVNNYGRPTKGAAYGLLAKTYAQHHKWEEAKRCLEWLIDGEGKNYFLLAELNGRTVRIAKLSKACRERLDRLRSNGYTPCSAEVRFVVAWKKEDADEEIPVILSDIHLQKNTAAQ